MSLNIDKYTNQIKNENEKIKKYKKIGLHIIVSIFTACFFIILCGVLYYAIYSPNKESDLKDAKNIYEFVAMNTDGLMDYCSITDYIPKQYIYLFNNRLKNTIYYNDEIISKYTNIGNFKQQIRSDAIELIEQDFQSIRKKCPQISKNEYCKMYDYKPKELMEYKIDIFRKHYSKLLKD